MGAINLFKRKNTLSVLLYHRVIETGHTDYLTVSVCQLRMHFNYLRNSGYTVISMQDLLRYYKTGNGLPHKSVLLSFDDGYKNNLTCLYPLLKEFGYPACIFLIGKKISEGPEAAADYLQPEDLKSMDPHLISFGIHSFRHNNFKDLSKSALKADLESFFSVMGSRKIPVLPCIAYPYGAFPKRNKKKKKIIASVLRSFNIELGFRIGNRINSWPLHNPYLIQRLDIRGTESFNRFKIKLHYGGKSWKSILHTLASLFSHHQY